MLRLPFVSYGGTHILNEELRCVPADPDTGPASIILNDKVGYYGFINDLDQLRALHAWLTEVLHGTLEGDRQAD